METTALLRAKRLRKRLEQSVDVVLATAKTRIMDDFDQILVDYLNDEDKVRFLRLPWE